MTAVSRRQASAAAGVLLGVTLAAVCYQRGSASFHAVWEPAACYSDVTRPAAQFRWWWTALLMGVTALAGAIWFPRSGGKRALELLAKGGLLLLAGLAAVFVSLSLAVIHTDQPTLKHMDASCY